MTEPFVREGRIELASPCLCTLATESSDSQEASTVVRVILTVLLEPFVVVVAEFYFQTFLLTIPPQLDFRKYRKLFERVTEFGATFYC